LATSYSRLGTRSRVRTPAADLAIFQAWQTQAVSAVRIANRTSRFGPALSENCMLTLDVRTIGRHMARQRRQNGWVEPTGKRPRTWTGFWYEYEQLSEREIRRRKSRVLGLRSELTKGDAEERLRALIRNGTRNFTRETQSEVLMFETAANRYLELKKGDWGSKMNSCLRSIFKKHIIPGLGARAAVDIKPSDIKSFLNNLADVGSESLLKKAITHIRAVFDILVEDDKVKKNLQRPR
jgi:hypothetical protein